MRRALLLAAILIAVFEGTYLWVGGAFFPAPPLRVVCFGQDYIISGQPSAQAPVPSGTKACGSFLGQTISSVPPHGSTEPKVVALNFFGHRFSYTLSSAP